MRKLLLLVLVLFGLYGCTGGNDDTFSSSPIEPTPPPPPFGTTATYLLSANRDPAAGGISVFTVDTDTGSLALTSSVATSGGVNAITRHPRLPFIYASLVDAPVLDGYSIDPASGVLTRLPGFPIASEQDSHSVFDPPGKFLYVLGETTINAFAFNDDGSLTQVAGFPQVVPGLVEAQSVILNRAGTLLLFTDAGGDQVFAYQVDPSSGAVTFASATPTAQGPTGLQFDPVEEHLFVNGSSGALETFNVSADGAVSAVPGGQVAFSTPGAISYQMGFQGIDVYVGDGANNTLNAFEAGFDGTLTQLPGFPIANGGAEVVYYPQPFFSGLLYVSDFLNDRINGFRVDENGNLSRLPGSPFTAPDAPGSLLPVVLTY